MNPWGNADIFDARAIPIAPDPWGTPIQPQAPIKPDFADNEQLKQAFGVALGRGLKSFDAGMEVFEQNVSKGLWASINWANDPLVLAVRDNYLKSLKKLQKPLDKEELLAEVLDAARSAIEDKDRVGFFKLYSDIAGFTGKAVEVSTNFNNTTNNLMKITLVKSNEQEARVIAPNIKSKIQHEELSLPQLKLVGGGSR